MWVIYTIAATLLLSLSTIFAKCGSRRADASVITTLRTLITTACMWAFILINNIYVRFPALNSKSFLYLIISGIVMTGALYCYHISLKSGDVTRVSALEKLSTVLLIIAAIFLYKQTSLYYIRIICTVLIAVGIIIVVTKKSRSNSQWLLFGILSAICTVVAYILATTNIYLGSNLLTLTFLMTISLILALIIMFIRGIQKGISRIPFSEILFIILSGLSAGAAWYCFRNAYYIGNTNTVIAITSMTVATSATLAALFLKEKVSWKSICGILFIITGILMYIFMI